MDKRIFLSKYYKTLHLSKQRAGPLSPGTIVCESKQTRAGILANYP